MIPKHNDDLWNAIRSYVTACGGTPHGAPSAQHDETDARSAVLEVQRVVYEIEKLAQTLPVRTPADPSRMPKVMWLPEASILAIREGRYEDGVRAMKPIDLFALIDVELARAESSGAARLIGRAVEAHRDRLASIEQTALAAAVLERVSFAIFVSQRAGAVREALHPNQREGAPPANAQETLAWMPAWLDLSQDEREPWRAVAREALFGHAGPVAGAARAEG